MSKHRLKWFIRTEIVEPITCLLFGHDYQDYCFGYYYGGLCNRCYWTRFKKLSIKDKKLTQYLLHKGVTRIKGSIIYPDVRHITLDKIK